MHARGRLPIVVGGTGFYYRALTRGLFPGPGRDAHLRERLRRLSARRGVEFLHRMLGRLDPPSALRIQPRDLVRRLQVDLDELVQDREAHLAGATVLRGPMGFGKSSRLHTAKILQLSMDLPLVIEIVDEESKLREFLPLLDSMMQGGLITLERVQVLDYRARSA